MLKAKKGNKALQIKEFQVSKYLSLGYSIIREDGTVLKTLTELDIPMLQQKIKGLEGKLSEVMTQNLSLMEQNVLLMKELDALKNPVKKENPDTPENEERAVGSMENLVGDVKKVKSHKKTQKEVE